MMLIHTVLRANGMWTMTQLRLKTVALPWHASSTKLDSVLLLVDCAVPGMGTLERDTPGYCGDKLRGDRLRSCCGNMLC